MKLNSSQRWAVGAVALALLIACSPNPQAPDEPVLPQPNKPTLSSGMIVPISIIDVAPQKPAPGFAGIWAFGGSECGAARTFRLSPETIDMTAGERSCVVTSISEENPTGRSMIYTVMADCLTKGEATKDRFTLNFGAADTIMQLQLNDRTPVRLVRCPQAFALNKG